MAHFAMICRSGLVEVEQATGLETAMQAAAIAVPPRLDTVPAPGPPGAVEQVVSLVQLS